MLTTAAVLCCAVLCWYCNPDDVINRCTDNKARWCGQSKRGPIGDATEEVDWVIGEIMATIASSKAKDDTLVFFTSDNGAPQRPVTTTLPPPHLSLSLSLSLSLFRSLSPPLHRLFFWLVGQLEDANKMLQPQYHLGVKQQATSANSC